MDRVLSLTFASSLTDFSSVNSSFDSGVLRIAYTGDNRNRSHISKQAFENCIKTMYNCPIVCNYVRETDSLGGHDMEVVRPADGGLRIVNVTEPVGTIAESARHWWDTVEEEDGSVHEYLFVEALLWKRQEAYRKIRKDGITAQSMEITVRDGEIIDGVYHIRDFEFTAFCLLGSAEPCYESAALEMYSLRNFKQQFSEMMRELKESFSVNPSEEVDNTYPQELSMEGGEKVLHEKTELAAKYGINVEALDFSLDEFSIEELAEKFEAMKAEAEGRAEAEEANGAEAFSAEPGTEAETSEDPGQGTFALTSGITEELYRCLDAVTVEREWGVCRRYCYVDCDFEAMEVYCWDTNDWLLYGFRYSMNGDNAVIDFESRKRMKYAIVEFDEGEQASPVASVFERMEEQLRDGKQWEEKYQTASDTITSMETELKELRQFKADTENAALQSAREEVFAQFEDLIGVEAFDALRANCESYRDMEALKEKCYAIRGRAGTQAKFALGDKTPKLKVVRENNLEKEPYGGIFAHFGIEAE